MKHLPDVFPSSTFFLFQLFPDPQDPAFHLVTSKQVIQAPGLIDQGQDQGEAREAQGHSISGGITLGVTQENDHLRAF